MAKQYFYEYEVTGRGHFPFDMLRYDRCWPTRESEDSGHIEADTHLVGYPNLTRTIRVTGLNIPTSGRWESFGWTVDLPSLRRIG